MRKILSVLVGASVLCLSFFYAPAVARVHAATVTCNCLTSDMATYTVGQSPVFTITGATPNSVITWTFVYNGTLTSQAVSYGQTDGNGHYVMSALPPFTAAGSVGTWTASMTAGTATASVTFTVQAASSSPGTSITSLTVPKSFSSLNFSVNSDARHYATGQTPVFTITGAPANSPITYAYSENGASFVPGTVGNAGASTNASGGFTGNVLGLGATNTASWVVGFSVGSETGIISYTTGSSYPFTSSSSSLNPGSVGSVYSGSVTYGYTGTAATVDVVVFNLPTGVVPSAHYTLTGTSITEYEVSAPVTAGTFSVGLTGTPTQGGTFPVFVVVGGSSVDPIDFEMVTLPVSGTSAVAAPTSTPTPTPASLQVPTSTGTGSLLQVPDSGSSSAQPYAPGTLVNWNGTVFLIIAGYQVPFLNWNSFIGLGYSSKNIVKANLSNSGLTQTPGIGSANVSHTWGSWVSYRGTVYYSSEQGMVPAPDMATFYANHGDLKFVLPANKYDIDALNASPNLSPLVPNDPRVLY